MSRSFCGVSSRFSLLCVGTALVLNALGCAKPEDSTFNLEKPLNPIRPNIFGKDDRRNAPMIEAPYTRVVRVKAKGFFCSGALVGKRLVLTNAHCIDQCIENKKIVCDITVYAGYRKGNYLAKSRATRARWGTLTFKNNRQHDWAILKLADPLGKQFGYFGYYYDLSKRSSLNKDVTLSGFSSDYKDGEVMWRHQGCRIRKHNENNTVFHDCDMTRGASGAAIFKCNDKGCYIVALNVAEYRGDSDTSLRVDKYPEDKGNVAVHPRQYSKFLKEWRELYK